MKLDRRTVSETREEPSEAREILWVTIFIKKIKVVREREKETEKRKKKVYFDYITYLYKTTNCATFVKWARPTMSYRTTSLNLMVMRM